MSDRIRLREGGAYFALIGEADPPEALGALVRRLWSEATAFAWVRRERAVTDATGRERAIAAAAPFAGRLVEARWATQWPGTHAPGTHLWIRCRAGGEAPFPLDIRTLWKGFGEWEDLQLLRDDALLLYVRSQEGLGMVWGDEALCRSVGMECGAVAAGTRWDVVGPRVEADLFEALRGPAASER